MPDSTAHRRKVLVVDDEPRIIQFIRLNLEHDGFEVYEATSGPQALEKMRDQLPDLILLDVMMPDLDGFETLRLIREISTVPVIMLTAKGEEDDRVQGLELGADDYVTKPFSMNELTARIRAVLRRSDKRAIESDILRVADITLDRAGRVVTVGNNQIDLTPSEFGILAILMSAPGRAFSRLELLERMQGSAYEGYERTIDVHVRNLRTKIEADISEPQYIETVYGVGYRFAPQSH